MPTIGKRRWAMAEGYIPCAGHPESRELVSHETACILNTNDIEANVRLTIYFDDREPAGPFRISVPARRTRHVRFNDLDSPEPIPRGVDYSAVLEADVPVVVQQTRLDSRSPDVALFSTLAFAD